MKVNKTLILILMLILLGGAAYYISNKSNEGSSYDISDRQFAVEERSDISKIFLAYRNGKSFILEKKNNEWFVNDEYLVHPNIISNMLDVLTGVELKYIPPQAAYKNMVQDIAQLGIKVEIFDENNTKLKSYQVGGTTSGELGTVFIMENAIQPFVMELPNFEGSLRGRFLFDHVDQFRDRTVFEYEDQEISEISIVYPKDQKSSFKLTLEPEVRLTPISGNVLPGEIIPGAIERFLRGFRDLDAEAFENQHELRDSIESLVPVAEIKVKDRSGKEKVVKLHSLIDVFNPEIITREVNVDPRVERYFAQCSWGDFMLVQHLLFRRILWKYEDFFTS